MKRVRTRYNDGHYEMYETLGPIFIEVDDDTWALYQCHIDQDNAWHNVMRKFDNTIFEMEENAK